MDLDTTQTVPQQAAPDTNAAPPNAAPPIGGMAQPGPNAAAPAATPEDPNMVGYKGAVAAEQAAVQKATASANAPTPAPYTGPHARLLSMIQGLGIGLSSFGTALATHGKEGGAPEVQEFQAKRQEEKIQAQQAAAAQKNTQTQQQLLVGETNRQLAQSYLNLMTAPDLISKSHVESQKGKLDVIGQTQDIRTKALQDLTVTGDLDAYNNTLKQTGEASAASPTGAAPTAGATPAGAGAPGATTGAAPTPGAPAVAVPPMVVANWKNSIDAASSAYPNDPTVQNYKAVLANPKSTPQQMAMAANGAKNRMSALDAGAESRTKQEAATANSPISKLSTPEALAMPGVQSAIQAKIDDPATGPADVARLKALLPRADLAQKNALEFDAAKERQKQAITDGDPKAAGALLQSGLVSPQELVSSRKPQFAQQAFDEAIRLGGGVKGADGKWTGGTWSATKAESQYEYAKNPKTQNTLNLLSTMQAPGGSIDIAKKEFDNIPGKIDEKTFNKILTGAITEFGGTSVTNFQAAMTSLADEYAQVLQGGAATETTLSQAKDLIQKAYTKNQGAGVFDVIGQDMAARQKGMVRDNPALNQMYPQPTAAPTGASGKAKGSDGNFYYHDAKGNILGPAPAGN